LIATFIIRFKNLKILFHFVGSDGFEFFFEFVDHSVDDDGRQFVRAQIAFPFHFFLIQRADGQHEARGAFLAALG
jgi:hypothetical protein